MCPRSDSHYVATPNYIICYVKQEFRLENKIVTKVWLMFTEWMSPEMATKQMSECISLQIFFNFFFIKRYCLFFPPQKTHLNIFLQLGLHFRWLPVSCEGSPSIVPFVKICKKINKTWSFIYQINNGTAGYALEIAKLYEFRILLYWLKSISCSWV